MSNDATLIDKTEGRSLRVGFLRSAAEYPTAPALIVRGKTLSYEALERKARIWAHAIIRALERPAYRVGVFAYRSETSYAGVLAALFSGAAFVPLNPTLPVRKTRDMVRLADLDAMLVDRACLAQLEAVLADQPTRPLILIPDEDAPQLAGLSGGVLGGFDLDGLGPLDELPAVLGDEMAYLLFTSGSTGQPKGVPVTHANVLHFIDVMSERYRITSQDRLSQTFDQTFDLSVFDLFMAWECGACVCAMQPIELLAPGSFLRKHGVTVWFSVPSLPTLMLKKNLLKPGSLPTLRWSLFCGEPLTRAAAEAWQAAAPGSIVENLYGPTELTIACFVYRWDPGQSPAQCVNDIVPIGRPYPGLGALVLDQDRRPVPENEPGELYVCGPQTVPGYWRDSTKTAERFISLPIEAAASLSMRFYATGDRVMRVAGGDYVYIGRMDHQIKVLGYRVELGEIEATLRRIPGVVEAVAYGWPAEGGTAQGITVFVSGTKIDPNQVKSASHELLPDYMSPREVFVLDHMPLNANGKIDRNALRARLKSGTDEMSGG
jgi:amino acid adenylation domain-containing protein